MKIAIISVSDKGKDLASTLKEKLDEEVWEDLLFEEEPSLELNNHLLEVKEIDEEENI